MKESEMHVFAGVGTAFVVALLVLPTTLLAGGGAAAAGVGPQDLMVIEASLAYKATKNNQPQKPKRQAIEPVVEGVATDVNQPPPPPDPTKPKPSPTAVIAETATATIGDDDPTADIGDTDQPIGDFNGSEYGFDQFTKGDPFFQALKGDLIKGWEYPAILNDAGIPIGCLQLMSDGKIPQVTMKATSGIAELDDSVERQLTALQLQRNDKPIPVPTHLLATATTRWVCFKFNPKVQ